MCGVKYDVGMESRHHTKEDIAPEEKNNIVQDITYVAILKDYGKDVTIPCPEGYNKDEFDCACASQVCSTPKEPDRVWMSVYGTGTHYTIAAFLGTWLTRFTTCLLYTSQILVIQIHMQKAVIAKWIYTISYTDDYTYEKRN